MVRTISDKTLWMVLNTAVLIAFIFMCAINATDIFVSRTTELSAFFVFEGILLLLTFAGLIVSYFTEYRFMVYAVLCFVWGIDGLLSGRGLIGFVIYAASFPFLWRQRSLSTKSCLALVLASLPIPTASILLSYEGEALSKTLMQVIAFAIICALSFFLILPVIAKKRITVSETIDVTGLGLSDREIRILESALMAEKYTTIASTERISVSYVKKCMKSICRKMKVADRTELLATYAGYTVGGTAEKRHLTLANGERATV